MRVLRVPDSVTLVKAHSLDCGTSNVILRISPDHPALALIGDALFSKKDKKLIRAPIHRYGLKTYEVPEGIRIIGEEVFQSCYELKHLVIPDSVTEMGASAFSECRRLKKATLSSGMKEIPEQAFIRCVSLDELTIPEGVTTIGKSAFAFCTNLHEVALPGSVATIDDGAFNSCDKLEKITVPASVTRIGDVPFGYAGYWIMIVDRDSFAQQYCEEHDIRYTYPNADSWLHE